MKCLLAGIWQNWPTVTLDLGHIGRKASCLGSSILINGNLNTHIKSTIITIISCNYFLISYMNFNSWNKKFPETWIGCSYSAHYFPGGYLMVRRSLSESRGINSHILFYFIFLNRVLCVTTALVSIISLGFILKDRWCVGRCLPVVPEDGP